MNYSHFLFAMLLQDYFREDKEFQEVPYDLLYEELEDLYNCFYDSDENIETKSEYDCISNYIVNNESFIINTLKTIV